jgi:transposase
MCPATDNPTSCKIRAVIHFLHAKNMSAAEINRELCMLYGQKVMSEGTVRQWCRMFRDGQTNIHNEEQSGRPSVVSDDLVQSEKRCFTISEPSCEFPQISLTLLYEIITFWLGYHTFAQDGF